MFSLITAYIKNIVVLLIFSLFAEMLLPDNRFRGYIKIVTGVVLIAVILKPLGQLVNDGKFNIYDVVNVNDDVAEINTDDINSEEFIFKLYEENIEEKVKQILTDQGVDIKDVKVETEYDRDSEKYGGINSIDVFIESDEVISVFGDNNNSMNRSVKDTLTQQLDIPDDNINIVYN